MKHRSVKKEEHIVDYECSSSSIIKIRQTSIINIWQTNKNLFCQNQYHSKVNWSDKVLFASDNRTIHCHYILLKHARTSETVRHFCRNHGDRDVFSLHKTDWELAPKWCADWSVRRITHYTFASPHDCYFKSRFMQCLYEHPPS